MVSVAFWPRISIDTPEWYYRVLCTIWGDGFAVVYSVTDRCSFDEVMRLCFLINHIHSSPKRSGGSDQPPVVIVGNKKDLQFDRMVSCEDGENLSKALKLPFYEISTRDSYEETVVVFNTLYNELMRQGHFSPGSFKRRAVSKLMEKIPKMHANSTLNSGGRSLTPTWAGSPSSSSSPFCAHHKLPPNLTQLAGSAQERLGGTAG
uniref:small monomeric GTPase n=1 Tax=Gopherus evgoodei TaxID=1825980 RepID=A0A8C4WQJ0_9SAUR